VTSTGDRDELGRPVPYTLYPVPADKHGVCPFKNDHGRTGAGPPRVMPLHGHGHDPPLPDPNFAGRIRIRMTLDLSR